MTECKVSVYLVACGDSIKIGMSNNPAQRLKDMKTGMPERPVLLHSREFPDRATAHVIEQELHRHFRHRRATGEWFRIGAEEAKSKLRGARVPKPLKPGEASKRIAALFDAEFEKPRLV